MPVIVDIDLPETCSNCRLFEYSSVSNCKLLKKPLQWDDANTKRDDDCPLRAMQKQLKDAFCVDDAFLEESNFEL